MPPPFLPPAPESGSDIFYQLELLRRSQESSFTILQNLMGEIKSANSSLHGIDIKMVELSSSLNQHGKKLDELDEAVLKDKGEGTMLSRLRALESAEKDRKEEEKHMDTVAEDERRRLKWWALGMVAALLVSAILSCYTLWRLSLTSPSIANPNPNGEKTVEKTVDRGEIDRTGRRHVSGSLRAEQ